MDQQFCPMDAEYGYTKKELKRKAANVLQTLASLDNFPGTNLKERQRERDLFVVLHNSEYGNTRQQICEEIALTWLTKKYCHWCNVHNHPTGYVIEHQHIRGTAGRYRGVSCRSCNGLEGKFKNKSLDYKINHLHKKIGHKVISDRIWVTNKILECYTGAVDDDGDTIML